MKYMEVKSERTFKAAWQWFFAITVILQALAAGVKAQLLAFPTAEGYGRFGKGGRGGDVYIVTNLKDDSDQNFTTHVLVEKVYGPTELYADDIDVDNDVDVLSAFYDSWFDETLIWYENMMISSCTTKRHRSSDFKVSYTTEGMLFKWDDSQ